jgi:two-component system LytT family response regulator
MIRVRALVAEDEPLARKMVLGLLARDPEIEAVIECADATTAREALERQRCDIAFLDVEMPGASGLDLAQGLTRGSPVIVFVTAFSQHAPNAFDVEAVDYVLKPFSDERFFEAVERAKKRVREQRLGALVGQLASVSAELRPPGDDVPEQVYLTRLSFKDGDRSVLLNTSDVLWIEAEDYYVLVHAKRGRHMIRATLASLEERLDPRVFLRVHRAAIVNRDEIREVRDDGHLVIQLSNGAEVAVSRSRRRHVEPALLPHIRSG